MHIYIIALYQDHSGHDDDKLIQLGREYVEWGHEVTFFTGLTSGKMILDKQKIGLKSVEGINYLTFNVNYTSNMSAWQKLCSYQNFARLVTRQGRQMPRPDLIFVLSPPLIAVFAAVWLRRYYRVPLVTEIRMLLSAEPAELKNLSKRVFNFVVNNLEKNLYQKADWIIATDQFLFKAIREKLGEDGEKKVTAVAGEDDFKEMLDSYDNVIAALLQNKD